MVLRVERGKEGKMFIDRRIWAGYGGGREKGYYTERENNLQTLE